MPEPMIQPRLVPKDALPVISSSNRMISRQGIKKVTHTSALYGVSCITVWQDITQQCIVGNDTSRGSWHILLIVKGPCHQ